MFRKFLLTALLLAGCTTIVAMQTPVVGLIAGGIAAITGGTINGTSVGSTTPAAGAFTALSVAGTSVSSLGAAWVDTTPALTSSSGTITSSSALVSVNIVGKTAVFNADAHIITAGPAAGSTSLNIPMPITAKNYSVFTCTEHGVTGALGSAWMPAGSATLTMLNGNGAVNNGYDWNCTGVVQTQ